MKGIGLFALFAVIFLLGEALVLNTFIGGSLQVQIAARESEILRTLNRLTILQRGFPYAANYSFFQAEYQIGKNGGYKNETDLAIKTGWKYPYWRIYESTHFPDDYILSIEELTASYFEDYFNSVLHCEGEKTPSYTAEISPTDQSLSLLLTSSEEIVLKGEDFNLTDIPSVAQNESKEIVKMFSLGKDIYVDRDNVSLSIKKAAEDMSHVLKNLGTEDQPNFVVIDYTRIGVGEVCSKLLGEGACQQGYVCENHLSELPDPEEALKRTQRGDADQVFNETIKKEIASANGNYQETLHLSASATNVSVEHKGEIKIKKVGQCSFSYVIDCSASCPSGEKVEVHMDSTTICECRIEVPSYDVTYLYNYSGAAEVQVIISSNEMFPVYDGTTAYRNLTLQFHVISSYPYDYKPLSPEETSITFVKNPEACTVNCEASGKVCCWNDPNHDENGCVDRKNLKEGEECYCSNECGAGLNCNPTTEDFKMYKYACCPNDYMWNGTACVLPTCDYGMNSADCKLPEEWNWDDYQGRNPQVKCKNCITWRRDQGSCGSCYLFAAVGAIESAIKIQTGEEVDLAEQEFLNTLDSLDAGCNGAPPEAVVYFAQTHGFHTENCYPYATACTQRTPQMGGKNCFYFAATCKDRFTEEEIEECKRSCDKCEVEPEYYLKCWHHFCLPIEEYRGYENNVYRCILRDCSKVYKVTSWGYEVFNGNNYEKVKRLIVEKGPLATAIDGGCLDEYYKNIPHGVVLIGYTKDGKLLIRNSWLDNSPIPISFSCLLKGADLIWIGGVKLGEVSVKNYYCFLS